MKRAVDNKKPAGIDVSLGSMGWITSDKVRAGVSCPKCKAAKGASCIGIRYRTGIVNHRERQMKYRRAQRSPVRMVASR